MWPPFVHLLFRTWQEILRAFSTSALSIIVGTVAIPTLTWLGNVGAQFWRLRRKKAMSPLREAIAQSWVSASVTTGITIVAWIVILGCFITKTVYDDHKALVSQNRELTAEHISLGSQLDDAKTNAEQRCEERTARR
jgi:hypothetical protein